MLDEFNHVNSIVNRYLLRARKVSDYVDEKIDSLNLIIQEFDRLFSNDFLCNSKLVRGVGFEPTNGYPTGS